MAHSSGFFLGIDLGTSSVKVLLMDDAQQVVGSAQQGLSVSRLHPLWSEQDPLEWWRATQLAVQELRQRFSVELAGVRAMGLSGQQHGATLLDKSDSVLRPAILWNDQRAIEECALLLQREPRAHEITGNLIMPGFTAPKVLWVQKHEPDIFKRIAKILLPKDYLRLRLTGDYATDLSDASGTAWVDVAHRRYSLSMIEATDITLQQLPELFEGSQITGTVTSEIAKAWGIPADCVVVGGGGDNAASAISMGVVTSGSALISLGTSGVYFAADGLYQPNTQAGMHTMCHCLPNLWHEMTVHLSAASCLTWLSHLLHQKDVSVMIENAATHHKKNTPLFLPYLSGERTPINDSYARGVFFGLNHDTQSNELTQSVLEGVAFAFAQGQQAMLDAGIQLKQVSVIGGGARSHYWGKILATVLKRPLIYRKQAEVGGALGAARLAWFALTGGDAEKVLLPPPIDFIIEPQADEVDYYESKLKLYTELYQQIKPIFKTYATL